MKSFLTLFATLSLSCITSANAYTGTLPDWKSDAFNALSLPEYAGKYVEICVEDDCLRVDRSSGERGGGISDGLALAVKPVGGVDPLEKEKKMGAIRSPVLDGVLDKIMKAGSARGKVKIKYHEKSTQPDKSSKEINVEVEIEAGIGEGAADNNGEPPEDSKGVR